MERVLYVSRPRAEDPLLDHLRTAYGWQPALCHTAGQALERAGAAEWGLIVINAPLQEGAGEQVSIQLARQTTAAILLLLPPAAAEEMVESAEGQGVFVLRRPVGRGALERAIHSACVARNRLLPLRQEKDKLAGQLRTVRLVSRAKLVLMQDLNMTEDQAHKYIEQQAMIRRLPKERIAQTILRTYEH